MTRSLNEHNLDSWRGKNVHGQHFRRKDSEELEAYHSLAQPPTLSKLSERDGYGQARDCNRIRQSLIAGTSTPVSVLRRMSLDWAILPRPQNMSTYPSKFRTLDSGRRSVPMK